jgi:hemolysin III
MRMFIWKRMTQYFREPVNGLSHFFAALLAVFGVVILLAVSYGNPLKQSSLLIYGISLVALLSASAAYHLVKASPDTIQWLRKLDHSAIFLLIAGTYTPVCINLLSGFWKWGILSIIWGIALVGTILKIAWINSPRALTTTIYLGMGWLAVLGGRELLEALPPGALIWLASGGLFFTLGAVVYVTKIFNFFPGVFGFHEVWHIFVIAGCFCHYMLMLLYVAPHGQVI